MNGRILTAGLCSLLLLGGPAALAAGNGTQMNATSPAKMTAQEIVANAIAPIQRVKADKHFNALLSRAKGVAIFPSVAKGALVAGGSGGEGVILARNGGKWSDPAFLSVGSISLGAQVGGKAGPVVMLLMSNKALDDMTARNNFSLNANAGLTIVNYSAKGQGGFGKGDVIVWSGAGGAFVGASVSIADIAADPGRDAAFYGKTANTAQIIQGHMHNAHAEKLIDALSS